VGKHPPQNFDGEYGGKRGKRDLRKKRDCEEKKGVETRLKKKVSNGIAQKSLPFIRKGHRLTPPGGDGNKEEDGWSSSRRAVGSCKIKVFVVRKKGGLSYESRNGETKVVSGEGR